MNHGVGVVARTGFVGVLKGFEVDELVAGLVYVHSHLISSNICVKNRVSSGIGSRLVAGIGAGHGFFAITRISNLNISRIETVDGALAVAIVGPGMGLAVVKKHHVAIHTLATLTAGQAEVDDDIGRFVIGIDTAIISNLIGNGFHRGTSCPIKCDGASHTTRGGGIATIGGVADHITFVAGDGHCANARGFVVVSESDGRVGHLNLIKKQGLNS